MYTNKKAIVGMLLIIVVFTAFYMFRIYYLIFWGKSHYEEQKALYDAGKSNKKPHKPHEAPATMTIPLIILAIVSSVAGFIPFGKFISSNGTAYTIHIDKSVATTSIMFAVTAIIIATIMYKNGSSRITRGLNSSLRELMSAAYNRFYLDELWLFVTKKIIFNCISRPIAWFDKKIIDGSLDHIATTTQKIASFIRPLQSGNIQSYNVWFLSGALIIILILIYLV